MTITLSTHVFPWEVLGDPNRYALGCFEVGRESGHAYVVATDGKALVRVWVPQELGDMKPFLVPGKVLADLIGAIEKGQVTLEPETASITPCRRPKRVKTWSEENLGHYPPWRDVLPAPFKKETARARIDLNALGSLARAFGESVARLDVSNDAPLHGSIKATRRDGPLSLSGTLTCNVEDSTPPPQVGVNLSLLHRTAVAVCRPFGLAEATVVFRNPDEPMSVYPGDGSRTTTFGIVMPCVLS